METIEILVKKKLPENEIEAWADNMINGVGGFKSMEDHEFAVYADRDVAIAEFIIRCLANPANEDSQFVIDRIIEHRTKSA